MKIGSWDYTPNDFRLDKLGNGLFILQMPDIKLAFHDTHLIAFTRSSKGHSPGNRWIVKQNHWAEQSGKREKEEDHLQALQGSKWKDMSIADNWDTKQILLGERLETVEFFQALREAIENPPILLWLAAEQAKESMEDL